MQKKRLLFITFSTILGLFLISSICYAYQTIIINFPDDENWKIVYNQAQGREKIVQFVPSGQSYKNWKKTFIFHSYKYNLNTNATLFLRDLTTRLEQINNTKKYFLIKNSANDAIATRCITSNENIKTQCDIYRVTLAQEGVISIQYINKNVIDFKNNFNTYLKSVEEANPYYSEFRYDRVMSKGTSFEL